MKKEPEEQQAIPAQTEGETIAKKDQAGKIERREPQPCPDCEGVA